MRSKIVAAAACGMVSFAAFAFAQGTPPAGQAPAASQTPAAPDPVRMLVERLDLEKYKATIKEKTGDVTFAVDAKTKVTGPGAGTKTAEAKAAGKTTVLTDFVKVGDMVTVNYHEMDGTKHAANVRLMAATKK